MAFEFIGVKTSLTFTVSESPNAAMTLMSAGFTSSTGGKGKDDQRETKTPERSETDGVGRRGDGATHLTRGRTEKDSCPDTGTQDA